MTEQTPEEIAQRLLEFLTMHETSLLLEEGRLLFDFRYAKYSLSTEHKHCTLQVWSEERTMARRIVHIRIRKGALQIATMRLGQKKPQMLELVSDPDRRTPTVREQARIRFLPRIEAMLKTHFPLWRVKPFRTAMDLEKSFGPAYARGLMAHGHHVWAVVAINPQESPAMIDGILTIGLLWLQHCRQNSQDRNVVQGLRLLLPSGMTETTHLRMQWLREESAQWELYAYDLEDPSLHQVSLEAPCHLHTRMMHAPKQKSLEHMFAEAVGRAMELVPEAMRSAVELRARTGTDLALLLHGMEFARVRRTLQENSFAYQTEIRFGSGAHETLLSPESEPMLRQLVEQLFARRRVGGSPKDPLYRMQPERWLESMLRRDLAPLHAESSSFTRFDAQHIYTQVPAFLSGDRGVIDLLTMTRDGRLAILELKAEEDMHFALQALDYWIRVRWHHMQPEMWQQFGYFQDVTLQPVAPLLVLVAPSLRIHPATEIVLHFLKPEIAWVLLGLTEKWREHPKVVMRKRRHGA